MNNIPAILIADGAALMMMLLLLINIFKIGHTDFTDERLFIGMVLFTIFQSIVEPLTFLIEAQVLSCSHVLLLILNASLYIVNILFAYTWVIYADYKANDGKKRLYNRYGLISLPGAVVILGTLVNMFTPVFFRISENNIYTRTPFYLIPFLTTYLYLAYGVILIHIADNRMKKYLRLPAILFMIPILTCSMLQYIFESYSLIWLGVAISVLILYVNLQNETSYVDELSGLFTRKYLHNYMRLHLPRAVGDHRLGGIILDIDGFKAINDHQGHMTGDMVIATVGRLLRSSIDGNGFAARYGGDEFVVLAWMEDKTSLNRIVASIRQHEEAYNQNAQKNLKLHFSIGSTLYRSGESLDAFLSRMDQHMYADKRARSQRRQISDRHNAQQ